MLLLAIVTAAALRFWHLGEAPPGLYRDEAFNGLDALRVLQGEHALFFPANNGREPLYIYLTALAIKLFGQTTFAIRFAAATIGTLATLPMYALNRAWFGWRSGVLAAWVWALTFWAVHLSRIGLRAILIVVVLVLVFWLATLAYRRQNNWLWALAGLGYSLGFYTYLAYRFTPLLLLLVGVYMVATGHARRLWPAALWFMAGALLGLLPFILLVYQNPQLFLGRSGQVSILNPAVYQDSVLQTFGDHLRAAASMFVWRGDTIARHNLPGRPVFDPLMALPFALGLLWCLREWRRPPAAVLLLWLPVMLGPTILAADAPHFLRAAGVLPAAVLLAGLGLDLIWQWQRLPKAAGAITAALLVGGSLVWTVRDYRAYSISSEQAFAFESAATELAAEVNAAAGDGLVLLDDRLWTSWPSVEFLVTDHTSVIRYLSETDLPGTISTPATLFAWPYESLDFIPERLDPPLMVTAANGPLARGDLETEAYPLYVVYRFQPPPTLAGKTAARFGDQLELQAATYQPLGPSRLALAVYWGAEGTVSDDLVFFAHVIGPEGMVGQVDQPLGAGRWPAAWWQPGITLRDDLVVELVEPFNPSRHQITVGLYHAGNGERLPVRDAGGGDAGTAWTIKSE